MLKIWRQNGPNSDPPGILATRQMGLLFPSFFALGALGAPFEHRVPKGQSRSSKMSPKIAENPRKVTLQSSKK